jgi:hypothetical protein
MPLADVGIRTNLRFDGGAVAALSAARRVISKDSLAALANVD